MASWKSLLLDKAITRARVNGFNDADFQGWEDIPGEERVAVINQILHHGGAAQILLRRTFGQALWGRKMIPCSSGNHCRCSLVSEPGMIVAHDFHRMNMLIQNTEPTDQDNYLRYLKNNQHLWQSKGDTDLV